jgi:hypothetical protein
VLADGLNEPLGVVARDAERAPNAPRRGHRSPIMACTVAATSASPRGTPQRWRRTRASSRPHNCVEEFSVLY